MNELTEEKKKKTLNSYIYCQKYYCNNFFSNLCTKYNNIIKNN
jgi:hypothetical protein